MKLQLNTNRAGTLAFYVLCAGLVFVLASLLALVGPGKISAFLLAGIASLFLFVVPTQQLLSLMAILTFLVIGQLMYFAKITQALWIPYGLAMLLFFRLPAAYLKGPLIKSRIGMPLSLPLMLFIGIIVVSGVLNTSPPLQILVGGKSLLMFWSIFLLLALFATPFAATEKLVRYVIAAALLQFPFVLYQYLFVASKRSNLGGRSGAAWDAIVGSFGGDPNGGGASGTMAFILVFSVIFALSLRRYKEISWKLTVLLILVALGCIGLAEIKVVVVLLPLGVAALYWRELLRRPVRAAIGFLLAVGVALSILIAYELLHTPQPGQQAHDVSSLLNKDFGYVLDPRAINFETGEMGRNAALVFWWQEGFVRDPVRGVLGYGPGASRSSSSLAVGEVARRYSFAIDRSAASQMLWDVGLAGFLTYLVLLLAGAKMALQAASVCVIARTRATLDAVGAGLIMSVMMLPYSRDMLEVPALSFSIMLMLGLAVQANTLQRLRQAPFDHVA